MLVWLNGRWCDAARATVSALDRGLLFGDGVYDTWRTYDGEPFAVAAHLRRLAAAARFLRLPPPGPAATWIRRSRILVARNGLVDAGIRLTITRGAAGISPLPTARARATVLLTARALPSHLAGQQAHGIAAILLPFPRTTAPWAALKLIGTVSAVHGRRLAADRGATDGLYVTPDGHVTEGTTSNLFIVRRGVLMTPPLDGTLLGGVTRDLILRLARRNNIKTREAPLRTDDVRRADEVFLSASTVEILPVVRLDDRHIGTGHPGALTQLLQRAYRRHVSSGVRMHRGGRGVARENGRRGREPMTAKRSQFQRRR